MDKKSGFAIRFDQKFLAGLVSNAEEGVYIEKLKYHLAIHPAQLNDFKGALNDELSRRVARYDKKFSGILLGFKNVKPLSPLGHIGSDNIFIHLDIKADFFVFRPTVGMILNGIVTRKAHDHVGCLVYKTFNVSLPKSAADHEHEKAWLGSKVKEGDEVTFEILFLELETRLPYIRGKIRSIDNSSKISKDKAQNKRTTFEIEQEDEGQVIPKKKKDKKKVKEIVELNPEESPTKKKKKKRKHSELEALNDISFEETSENTSQSIVEADVDKKQKKKRKHSQVEAETSVNLVENFTSVNSTLETECEQPRKKKKRKTSELTMPIDDSATLENDEISPATNKKQKKNSNTKELEKSLSHFATEENLKCEDTSNDINNYSQRSLNSVSSKEKVKNRDKNEKKSQEKIIYEAKSRVVENDSSIHNKTPKNPLQNNRDLSHFSQTIDEVIKNYTPNLLDDSTSLKSSAKKSGKNKKSQEHVNTGSEPKIDLEKERDALIRRVKEIKKRHTNSFSGSNASDSSIDRITQDKTKRTAIKREVKTPSKKLTNPTEDTSSYKERNDSDSSIERMRVKKKREIKTPVREIKREVKTPVRESAQEKTKETTAVIKSKINGIAGSMSDWEVEDFSQRKRGTKMSKTAKAKEESIKVKEEVFSDAETLKKTSKRKKPHSQSISLNEDDLNNLFASPSTKLEPITDDEGNSKKTRRKSLSRSIDFKDIKMEHNSDIDDTASFSFSQSNSLNKLGLHTEVDLGIKENGDVLEQLGIS